ncbi:MAG: hypothetical protein IKI66_04485 [Bacteroidales bacterium]|nr:hypothetical protein [Bacteroidales bacterium]
MNLLARYLFLMSLLSFLGCGHNAPGLPDDVRLQYVRCGGTHGYHAYSNIDYSAERLENGKTRVIVEIGNDRDRVFEADGALMDTLETIVRAYRMDRYSGHYQPKMEILDGDSWSLELRFSDGSSTSCSGYMAYPPKGGAEALGKVEGTLSRWLYQEPAEEVALTSFRYEWHGEEGAEIYVFQKKDTGCSASVRLSGQDKSQSYEDVDEYLGKRLANVILWNHMASYTGEDPAKEDSSRPRWILMAEYENGQKISVMDYLDRELGEDSWRKDVPSFSEIGLRNETEQAFSQLSDKQNQ